MPDDARPPYGPEMLDEMRQVGHLLRLQVQPLRALLLNTARGKTVLRSAGIRPELMTALFNTFDRLNDMSAVQVDIIAALQRELREAQAGPPAALPAPAATTAASIFGDDEGSML